MARQIIYDSVLDYIEEVEEDIKKESKNPTSLSHLGYFTLHGLRKFPDVINQIDAATGEQDTNSSILPKAIDCATALINYGVGVNDVIVTLAPNHLDLAIVFYAGLLIASPFAGVDRTLSYIEMLHSLKILKPKIVFCQSLNVATLERIQEEIPFTIVSFDRNEESKHIVTFSEFVERNKSNKPHSEFKVRELPDANHPAFLISTSGSTGLPKCAIISHESMLLCAQYRVKHLPTKFPPKDILVFQQSPAQWVTFVLFTTASAAFALPRVQYSGIPSLESIYGVINKYKPNLTVASPAMAFALMTKPEAVDLSSFKLFYTTGSHSSDLLQGKLNKLIGIEAVMHMYGSTEISGSAFVKEFSTNTVDVVGTPFQGLECKIVDTATGLECKPGQIGELYMRGPILFKGYYNMPEETKETMTSDGWFKSGDLVYKGDDGLYYYVDRLKLCFKYNSIQISPAEVESVLQKLSGVMAVAVSGVPEDIFSSVPAALIVKVPGSDLTEEKVHDYMKENMSDPRQLRGGIVFTDKLPLTSTMKVDRNKVTNILVEAYKQKHQKVNGNCS